ncbi:MAG: glycosyltransferase [archaeon]
MITYVTSNYPNSEEPTKGIFVYERIKHVVKKHKVRMVAVLPFPKGKRKNIHPEVDTVFIQYLRVPLLSGLLFILRVLLHLAGEKQEGLLHGHFLYPDGFSCCLAKKLGIVRGPVFVTAHGSDLRLMPKNPVWRFFIKKTLEWADEVIVVSEELKEQVMRLGIDRRVNVIPNCVDTDLFKPADSRACRKILRLPQKRKIVLFVGRLVPTKNLGTLIKAMAEVDCAVLAVAGDGKMGAMWKNEADSAGIDVVFGGDVKHDDIPCWINSADVVVLPSLSEGLPTILAEAIACGKRIVASDVGGVGEVLTSEEMGYLVKDPMDHKEFARKINDVLDEKAGYDYRKYLKRFSGESYLREYEKLLKGVKAT